MNKSLAVFYMPRMAADSGSYSPSAGKPRIVVESWLQNQGREGVPAVRIVEPTVATIEQLSSVHDPRFVHDVLYGLRDNGFGNRRTDVCLSLPWTSGALLSAARYALAHPDEPAPCAPTSGYHHAGRAFSGGFCTFNGLMVAARVLTQEGACRKVGILDLDAHYSNGTDDIIQHFDQEWRAGRELHPLTWVENYSVGHHHTRPEHATRFMQELPEIVDRMARSCGLVIFQAGADMHRDDPLGGVLSTEELAERDRIVFERCWYWRVPCCWVFSGGYRRGGVTGIDPVVEVHTNTALAAIRACRGVG